MHHHYLQIAFVARDAYRAMNHWSALLGVGPWSVRRLSPQTMDEYVVAGRRVEEDVHVFLDTEATLGFVLEVGNQAPLSDAPELYPAP